MDWQYPEVAKYKLTLKEKTINLKQEIWNQKNKDMDRPVWFRNKLIYIQMNHKSSLSLYTLYTREYHYSKVLYNNGCLYWWPKVNKKKPNLVWYSLFKKAGESTRYFRKISFKIFNIIKDFLKSGWRRKKNKRKMNIYYVCSCVPDIIGCILNIYIGFP